MVNRSSRRVEGRRSDTGRQEHPYRAAGVALIALLIAFVGFVGTGSVGIYGPLFLLLGLGALVGSFGIWTGESWGYTACGLALLAVLALSVVGRFYNPLSTIALLGILALPHDLERWSV